YDIDNELFKEFLDQNMQYSCAYFKEESYDLDKAQLEKMRHIANKLLLKPGYKVLDIGCGWGGMAIFLAKNFDVHVTGLTLSDDQFNYAQEWIKKESLENKVTILKEDYREHEGQYDAIVSVG